MIKSSCGIVNENQTITSLSIGGLKTTNKLKICCELNKNFIVPVPKTAMNCDSHRQISYETRNDMTEFSLSKVEEFEIYKIVRELAPKKSFGWDGMSVKILKRIILYILKPLCHIVNSSLLCGQFPVNMKKTKIIPIYKKGDKNDASNYRPIAITSVFSKVYEKVFLTRLENHLAINNILIPEQHGFLKGKSTVTALFDFVTEVYGGLEAREKINVILYDFSNAFGTIYPPLLIRKLEAYGLNGLALRWLESFLTNREQYVEIREIDENNFEKHIISELLISNMGVPQGTVLGPTSFLVYLNDVKLFILIAFLLFFADDSSAIVKGENFLEVNLKTELLNDDFVTLLKTTT
jgi:hypothetical protein